MHLVHWRRPHSALLILSMTLCGAAAFGQAAPTLRTRALAATCASCHGTDGAAVPGQAMPRLAGLPEEYFVSQMHAFRDGKRQATVMHQISKGYDDEQIKSLAAYFASKQ